MPTFTYQATVNYPDDEQETPTFKEYNIDGVCSLIKGLLEAEGDVLTSCVIIITEEPE